MHQITDARAEMAKRLKLIGLAHRLQLLGNNEPTHQQDSQNGKSDSKAKALANTGAGFAFQHVAGTSVQKSKPILLHKIKS
ncbi:MAG: hypothetical protein ING08_07035 [Roseomonas sp.]|nr:hypothetical protein [Roseomonas sp.]MCA3379980.1 hypothetical protein [Roseomonas sp.]